MLNNFKMMLYFNNYCFKYYFFCKEKTDAPSHGLGSIKLQDMFSPRFSERDEIQYKKYIPHCMSSIKVVLLYKN